jgi:hypothetical protein
VRDVAVEFLRLEFGKKQAAMTPALLEKLKKACNCHLSRTTGVHKDKCSLHPAHLKGTLHRHLQNRDTIKEQLMKRTSLSSSQRESALLHLFGPCSTASSSGAGRGPEQMCSYGGQPGNQKFLKTLPDPKGGCAGGCAGVVRRLCGQFRNQGPDQQVFATRKTHIIRKQFCNFGGF